MKKLNELFDIEVDIPIYSIHNDSRYVLPYSIFFCIEGLSVDGHQYVEDAIFQGAKCIVHSTNLNYYHKGIEYIQVEDTLEELNRVATLFYDDPSRKMNIVGVTGTSGKTVVASLVDQVVSQVAKTGYIGTLSISYDGFKVYSPYTTPESLFILRYLDKMVKANVETVAMEASSHGLSLKRVDCIDFNIAVLTNIEEEHLDFHGTMEQYVLSKQSLFEKLSETGYAIINNDITYAPQIMNSTKAKILTYSINTSSDIRASNIVLRLDSTSFDLTFNDKTYAITIPLVTKGNVYNVLALVGVLIALGYDDEFIVDNLLKIDSVYGRHQIMEGPRKSYVFVDYCSSIRNYKEIFEFIDETKKPTSRVVGVFGAPSKRSLLPRKALGKLANHYLDHVILTEVDDRGQSAEEICAMIQEEIVDIQSIIIKDRHEAVEQALEIVDKDDIILLLGKGHEEFISLQIGQRHYIGDANVVLEKLEEIKIGEIEDGLR